MTYSPWLQDSEAQLTQGGRTGQPASQPARQTGAQTDGQTDGQAGEGATAGDCVVQAAPPPYLVDGVQDRVDRDIGRLVKGSLREAGQQLGKPCLA